MRGTPLSRGSALLLVLMAFWCAPVKWLHSCGEEERHVHAEGRTVSIKEHCALCDLAISLATAHEHMEVKGPFSEWTVLASPALRIGVVSRACVRHGRAPPCEERA